MDIKDFILIGGGLLIAAVVAHGLWIAWRARRDPLRLDLVTDLPPEVDDEEDLKRLRAELPNGGARVVQANEPQQEALDLGRAPREAREPSRPVADNRGKTEPRLGPAPAAPRRDEAAAERRRDRVKDVMLPEPREPRRWPARKPAEQDDSAEQRSRKPEQGVEELIVLNVLAPKGKPFVGPALVETMRARGLRYGDMNIFHRVEPMTRATLYSVANVVEPGTFDMADLDNFRSPGVCFFMQLPGPEQPMDAFEDMLKVARDVAMRVGGELKDEQRSVMTGQTVEHYRQRITEFCRRRMSMRA